jgi:hypothetical protein
VAMVDDIEHLTRIIIRRADQFSTGLTEDNGYIARLHEIAARGGYLHPDTYEARSMAIWAEDLRAIADMMDDARIALAANAPAPIKSRRITSHAI